MEEVLNKAGITMKKIDQELVDLIWTTDRPQQPSTDINALPMQFAGKCAIVFRNLTIGGQGRTFDKHHG